jgi:hypothetical protein
MDRARLSSFGALVQGLWIGVMHSLTRLHLAQAEYTLPVIYSESSRVNLVYRIESRPPLQQAPLLNVSASRGLRAAALDGLDGRLSNGCLV